MANRSRCQNGERGAVAVEMALLSPILLLILGGVIYFGHAYVLQLRLTQAVHQVARRCALAPQAARPQCAQQESALMRHRFGRWCQPLDVRTHRGSVIASVAAVEVTAACQYTGLLRVGGMMTSRQMHFSAIVPF